MVHGTDTRPILLIDDDPDNREVMQLVLEHRGFQVITACNGVDGLRVLEELGRPELILLDWMMPTMSVSPADLIRAVVGVAEGASR